MRKAEEGSETLRIWKADTEEKNLIRRATRGNRKAAGELLGLYYREMYAFCYRQVMDREEAMDLTQEIFVSVLRNLSSYCAEKASFRLLIDRYRSASFRASQKTEYFSSYPEEEPPGSVEAENALEAALEKKETARAILQLLSREEPLSQAIFRMKVFGQNTFREIGTALSLPESTVKTRYYRTAASIRKEMLHL